MGYLLDFIFILHGKLYKDIWEFANKKKIKSCILSSSIEMHGSVNIVTCKGIQ